jgi:hypothetical protein
MKFRAGDLEFTASVVESGQSPSPQTGNTLQLLTIQFRAQKAGVHEAAVTEALQRQSGGLFSLDEADAPELEWRVRESNWTYVGTEPWGVNHHVWRIEQVERLACSRLVLGNVALDPYDYAENVTEGRVRLAARALVSEADLATLSRVFGPVEVTRVGISDSPRRMRITGYVWGDTAEGQAVVLACEDVVEPRVTVAGFQGSMEDELEDVIARNDEIIESRHARRRVSDPDAWQLME